MILSCPPAVVEWNASEEMSADKASKEAYCALPSALRFKVWSTAYHLDRLRIVRSFYREHESQLGIPLRWSTTCHHDDCRTLSTNHINFVSQGILQSEQNVLQGQVLHVLPQQPI